MENFLPIYWILFLEKSFFRDKNFLTEKLDCNFCVAKIVTGVAPE